MNNIYEEKQWVNPLFLILAICVIGGLLAQLYFSPEIIEDKSFLAVSAITLIFSIFIFTNFCALKITITDSRMLFAFGLFKRIFEIKNLQEVNIAKYSFIHFGGYGIRYGRQKTLGFIARGGQGISFIESVSKKKYYISTSNPEKILTLLTQYGAEKK